MINVRVELHGMFREYGKDKVYSIQLKENSTFNHLMLKLSEVLGERFKNEVYCQMGSNEHLKQLVFLNNKNVFLLGGKDALLKDGDCILFLPPMGGG